MRSARLALILLLIFDVWYRGHTFGPTVRDALGIRLWPAIDTASEPLDCDEAAYAYIGHRIVNGDRMYRDLTENKPPLGYWLYTLAVAVGGYRELAIRVLPIPFVLISIGLVWWIGLRLGGAASACLAGALFIFLSTDPYLFGNGSNFEHFINAFAAASLALLLYGWDRDDHWPLVGAGLCLGAATLVKQVAIAPFAVFVLALAWRAWKREGDWRIKARRFSGDVFSLGLGVATIMAIVAAILLVRGTAGAAYDDIVRYGAGLATDTLPEPNAPPRFVRLITGNADPKGQLPWPFGSTDYLVWWGTGSWPLWLASMPALAYFLFSKGTTAKKRLVAGWTLAAWAQVALPGLYWQHYYLLPIAGVAVTVAVCTTDAIWAFLSPGGKRRRGRTILMAGVAALLLGLGIGATIYLQVRDYLLVAPEELTIRYKGGRQWVELRKLAKEIAVRSQIWDHPRLYIWGWQSPLHFYSGLDSPTRHFFVDNLLRDQADRGHPLIGPRLEEITAALEREPPELILTGYAPFQALKGFLNARYLPSRFARGLWIKRDDFGKFEAAMMRTP